MNITKEHIKVGLLALTVLLLISFLLVILKRKTQPDNYKELINAKDSVISSVIRERETFRQWKDQAIAELQKKDSALKIEYKTTVVKYEKVPVTINNLNNEELRRAVSNY